MPFLTTSSTFSTPGKLKYGNAERILGQRFVHAGPLNRGLLCDAGSCAASGTRQRMGMTLAAGHAASPASRSCGGSWKRRACTSAMSASRVARWIADQEYLYWNTRGRTLEFCCSCTAISARCNVCHAARVQVFISEQVVYTTADLKVHSRSGDLTGTQTPVGWMYSTKQGDIVSGWCAR
jgi:hypothetical protein